MNQLFEYGLTWLVCIAAIIGSTFRYRILIDDANNRIATVFPDRAYNRAAMLQRELERILGDLNFVAAF
jgi:hypothetical protein